MAETKLFLEGSGGSCFSDSLEQRGKNWCLWGMLPERDGQKASWEEGP